MVQQMHAHMVNQQAVRDFNGLVGRANDQLKKWEVPVGCALLILSRPKNLPKRSTARLPFAEKIKS